LPNAIAGLIPFEAAFEAAFEKPRERHVKSARLLAPGNNFLMPIALHLLSKKMPITPNEVDTIELFSYLD